MNKNRIEMLKANGVDTGRFFTLIVGEDIKAGTRINISFEGNEVVSEIAKDIRESGYVKNTRLWRRWVAAQYMRMLHSDLGWSGYLAKHYGYMYQFDMMLDEVRVLAHLEREDAATFNERKQFFTMDVINRVFENYFSDMVNFITKLPKKKCRGRDYVTIKGYGDVFVDDITERIELPVRDAICFCHESHDYCELYNNMKHLKERMIVLPYDTKKSRVWIDAFQRAGAFYTLKNLVLFHGVELYYNEAFYDCGDDSMKALDTIVQNYEGYRMHALLKKTIEMNNFNFARSCEAHK